MHCLGKYYITKTASEKHIVGSGPVIQNSVQWVAKGKGIERNLPHENDSWSLFLCESSCPRSRWLLWTDQISSSLSYHPATKHVSLSSIVSILKTRIEKVGHANCHLSYRMHRAVNRCNLATQRSAPILKSSSWCNIKVCLC